MTSDAAAPTLDTIDLSEREQFRHGFPHEVFSVLREEAPVWKHPGTPGVEALGRHGFWVVSRHADIAEITRDPAHFRSHEGPRVTDWDLAMQGRMLITMDPPDHERLRRLVSAGFTPRMTAKLEEQARTWAVSIVEAALEKGECNFVDEVAYQLPMHMIADILGIPPTDREALFSLVRASLAAIIPETALSVDEQRELQMKTFMYGRELAEEKRRNPTDDVWSLLTTAEVTQADGSVSKLAEIELDLFFLVLCVAGSETTRDAISSGLLALLANPDQMERIRTDPSVMDTAANEIVRWASPVTYFRRTAVEDVEFKGAEIKAGDPVTLWFPSANRDAEVFDDPFTFDIGRTPNPQVGFGAPGIHYCLGANLARREIKVMFQEILARTSQIELTGEPSYNVAGIQSPIVFSLKDIPVRLTPAS